MLDRWRLAIVFALFGFVASAALITHATMGNFSELEVRWGWAVYIACPAYFVIIKFFPDVNYGTSTMAVLWLGQTLGNAAIWFAAGALLTKITGRL